MQLKKAAALIQQPIQNPSDVFGQQFGTVTYIGGGQISTASTPPSPPATSSRGLSKGAVAGIVVGSVVGFLIIVGVLAAVNGGLLWYYLKHYRTPSGRDEHGLPVTAPSQSRSATAPRAASAAAAPRAASAAAVGGTAAPSERTAAQGEQAAEPLELQPDQSTQKTSFLQKLKLKTSGQQGHQAAETTETSEPVQTAAEPQGEQSAQTTGFFQKLKLKGFRGGSAGNGYEAAPHTPRNV
ncbi:hypothetical protein WJX74_007666 [Apatococcus lobatus]|uniref:Uncharacterized protein n=1 Tax=Apatococcus lobatus TaxID=904363 RepID=A0AAW1QIX5_9CHLO